jgi:hypothetical protein
MEKISESKIQQECWMHFTNTYCLKHHNPRLLMFSVPNDSANVMEQMRKKATGLIAGVSDTIIVFPNKVVFCEFKDEKGRQSERQIEFEQRVNKLGFEYWIVRSLEQFKELVQCAFT